MPKPKILKRVVVASPGTPLHGLIGQVQDHIFLPDPAMFSLTLASVVGNMMEGVPVWTMLVGVAGCGKTLTLETLNGIPQLHSESSIKGPAAFLSGTPKKEKAKGATGGLLGKIGNRGMISIKDFQSILTLGSEARMETIGALRDIADGRWSRSVGSEGGKSLTWVGSVGFVGACTPSIDGYGKILSELGERWLYIRFPLGEAGSDKGYGETKASLEGAERAEKQGVLAELVGGYFQEMGWRWGCLAGCRKAHDHVERFRRRKLLLRETNRLHSLGVVVARVRSRVPREGRSHHICDVPRMEYPTRVTGMLGQIYLGLEAMGVKEAVRWRLVGKVARDSVRDLRMKVVREVGVKGGVGGVAMKELKGSTVVSDSIVGRVVEDLVIFKVLEVRGKEVRWTREFRGEWERGFGKGRK